ncbi:phosphatase 2C-like domain-containing protein [Mycena epipterygia]|nr:phosphatase 2C-like domain-containing protein [Mycena epipterygia]
MLWLSPARRQLNFSVKARTRRYSVQPRPYTFHIAADWAGKPASARGNFPAPTVAFPTDSPIVSWREKYLEKFQSTGKPRSAGEDFFLCTKMRHNSGVSLGVADGVGGWIEQGVDCSMFSQALMYYAHGHFENGWAGEPEINPILEAPVEAAPEGVEMTPSQCLELAYHDVLADDSVEAGSSTACLLTINSSSGILQSANLGDSGFCIIRSSSMFYISPPQTHYFNCPRQLAKLQSARGRSPRYEDSIRDFPRAAQNFSMSLQDGDLVIVYTDGLADNVFPTEILKICALTMNGPGSDATHVESIAGHLIHYARACMFSDRITPFELEARQHRKVYEGGKVDDVTVVVALVRETL